MRVIEPMGEALPIKCWAGNVEPEAMVQARNLARLPFAFHHIALMPDCHSGFGMPIGGVLAAKHAVIPNAVGVDIGCGMLAVKTTIRAEEVTRQHFEKIFGGSAEHKGGIRSSIPVGFNHHSKKQDEKYMPAVEPTKGSFPIIEEQYESARKQIGTLGGGNHFIEFEVDHEGFLWFTIHSGSRNLGHKVASHYNAEAKKKNGLWMAAVPPEWDLAFLPIGEPLTAAYIREMNYCVDFAHQSRRLMAERVHEAILEVFPNYAPMDQVNIAHNYAALEHHFGSDVWVHRKGATCARQGVAGVIPGSQGANSYIVLGRGNNDSFQSCSHGAGRTMSRTKARKTLNLAEEVHKMEEAGVLLHGLRGSNELDEAPGSYKDIEEVMSLQQDLVEILHTLRPLAVMKG